MSASSEHLPRLLALVPYLLAHPDARVPDVAATFEISERQLRDDLDLIFVCGLPGHTPADLMEVDIVDDRITLRNAEVLSRPLRLTAEEGLALAVALRTMVGLPAWQDPVRRALAKLESAVEGCAGPQVGVVVEENEVLDTIAGALDAHRRLHISYHVPSRDELTERDVDPILLTNVDGHYYLEGYCRSAQDVRVFRLDRIVAAAVLDTAAQVPTEVSVRDLSAGLYQPGAADHRVRLELAPAARWVGDYYACDEVIERPDGGLTVTLRTPQLGWVVRLLLSLGTAARALAPPELVELVRAEARAALAGYEQG
ncbi:MAG: helix-turn-helix transcriptional regulator [Mycobacteriales bacterium]